NPADVYLPQLKDKDADVRIAALRELLTSLDSRMPEAMLPLLSDEGNSIRRLAARAIGSRWWQIPKEKAESYVNALEHNLRSEVDFEDEKNMTERAIGQDEALWHPTREAVALSVSVSRRATSVWIWEHKHGVQKLNRSELIKLLHPKGKIDEPNPITAEFKEWKGDDLLVSVGWGFEDEG